jgi:hypothetical protein
MNVIVTYTPGPDGLPTIPKGVREKLTYSLDMGEYLAELGDGITIVEATADLADGLGKEGEVLFDETTVSVPRVSGGTLGQRFAIEYWMRLSNGEEIARTVQLDIVPR